MSADMKWANLVYTASLLVGFGSPDTPVSCLFYERECYTDTDQLMLVSQTKRLPDLDSGIADMAHFLAVEALPFPLVESFRQR